jgi:hypothetical protein
MKAKHDNALAQSAGAGNSIRASKISFPEAKEALFRSGYILEHRVENFLRHKKWYVETNTPYRDQETQKSRELDVYATTTFDIGEGNGIFMASIVAECVNNPQPLAFITKEDKYSISFGSDIKIDLGMEESFYLSPEVQGNLPGFLGLVDFHHYCFGRVATQYCSFARKEKSKDRSEWMATHDESHFNCFTTLIKALEHQLGIPSYSLMGLIVGRIKYPILILQGDLLDVRIAGEDLTLESVSHIKHRRSVIWNGTETGYMIDVVTEKGLPEFFAKLELELIQTADSIRRNAEFLKANTKPFRVEDPRTQI